MSGFHLSPSINSPVLASLFRLLPPSRNEVSPRLSPAASRNRCLWAVYEGHWRSTYLTDSTPPSHPQRALAACLIRARYSLRCMCSVRACARMPASSCDSDPYSCKVCFPGRALSIVYVYQPYLIVASGVFASTVLISSFDTTQCSLTRLSKSTVGRFPIAVVS